MSFDYQSVSLVIDIDVMFLAMRLEAIAFLDGDSDEFLPFHKVIVLVLDFEYKDITFSQYIQIFMRLFLYLSQHIVILRKLRYMTCR